MLELHQMRTAVERAVRFRVLTKRVAAVYQRMERVRQQLTARERALGARAGELGDLENLSVSSVLAWVAGEGDDRRRRARARTAEARMQRDDLCDALSWLQLRAASIEAERAELGDAERDLLSARSALYDRVMEAPHRENLLALVLEQSVHLAMVAELDEAAVAGAAALSELDGVAGHLTRAAQLATTDLFVKGFWVSVAKRNALDRARKAMAAAQQAMLRFTDELADVGENLSEELVTLSERDWVLEVLLDNIFTDLAVRRAIRQALANVAQVQERTRGVLTKIETQRAETVRNVADIDDRLVAADPEG